MRGRREPTCAEFPEGPFAGEVHLVLAHFHDDLFKVLKGGDRVAAYKRECSSPT